MVKGALVNTALTLPDGSNLVQVMNADYAFGDQLSSNQNLTPNSLLDSTGSIDYTQADWSRASWTGTTDPLRASWTSEDWTCQCSSTDTTGVDPTRASWTDLGWATTLN